MLGNLASTPVRIGEQPDSAKRDVWTVSRLNNYIKSSLEGDARIQSIWLEGEIFNLKFHSSGHIYFSLKDRDCIINCTFFKGSNAKLKGVILKEGMQITARGGVSVFSPRGGFQFNIYSLMPSGEGELRARIEELKVRLFKEGLFDSARKKEIPGLPRTLGVATSPTGAAIQDIIRVARARFPHLNILLAPCVVQGAGAAESIVEAIQILNDPEWDVDVIIAGRGGGSFEDLIAFNEESVVRAFANSRVPIVSAVGHEIDHPLSDLSADAFAATPSAAAEKVIPVFTFLEEKLSEFAIRLELALTNRHKMDRDRFLRILKSRVYQEPLRMFEPYEQRFDQTWRDLSDMMKNVLREGAVLMLQFRGLEALFEKSLTRTKNRYTLASERLDNFSPLAVLKRGYSVVCDENRHVIRKAEELTRLQKVRVILSQGEFDAQVLEIKPGRQ